ncbi:GIY-YIG nuclease family protein [Clostridium sp. K12(2020)]|nr:GIY-YIG nuclease family protein [Clostridium sp. K12(2020)]MBX9145855.1 GIY-YIG nuclease family protein [Clostridium sp. K13]
MYIIKVNDVPWYIGSTNNMPHRISRHINNKDSGHFVYMYKKRGIDLSNKVITIWICDTEKKGYNLTQKDLRYYEHVLIKRYREYGYPLLNTIDKSKFIHGERYIDEIPFDGFKFECSSYKLL